MLAPGLHSVPWYDPRGGVQVHLFPACTPDFTTPGGCERGKLKRQLGSKPGAALSNLAKGRPNVRMGQRRLMLSGAPVLG